MAHEFQGKTVLVTGALGALGSALALRFAAEGATAIASFRGDPARFNTLAGTIPCNCPGAVVPLLLDLSDPAAPEAAVREVLARFQKIDILINNAAVNESAPFAMIDDRTWDLIFDTNISAVWRLTTQAARPMMVRREGVVINISSVLAVALGRGAAAYAAAKAALNRFTEVAAQELGKKGIRVNGVAPGLLDTGLGAGMRPEAEAEALARTPLRRKGTIADVVEAVLFLASPRAAYITGHILTVDGGLSCG
jgi:3-oxoacyl-[acyl-carrier protein] reductase